MDSMQDEDFLWRRAFADSSGLFGNLSYGHSLAFADPAGAAQPPHDVPIPVLSGDSPNNVEPAVPTPSSPIPDFITTSSANQVLLPCPSVPASPSPAMYVQPCQAVMPSTAMPIASMGDWANSNAGAMENVPNAPKRMPASAAATAVILAVDEQDDYQVSVDTSGALFDSLYGLASSAGENCAISTCRTMWRPDFVRQARNAHVCSLILLNVPYATHCISVLFSRYGAETVWYSRRLHTVALG